MFHVLRATVCVVLLNVFIGVLTREARAVSPNPLENAYWRFEEGPASADVPADGHDPVLDSINQNHLDVFDAGVAPNYTPNVAPTPLKSGAANNLALAFTPNNDLITLFDDNNLGRGGLGKNINNGILQADGGFTIEAAFRPDALGAFQAIIGKEGQPIDAANLPTLALKIRDNNLLQFEQYDGAKNLVSVSSINTLNSGQWYYAAAVNDGSQLSLYLDSNDGNGYILQGSTAVDKPLYQGDGGYDTPTSGDWSQSWTVGRGQFDGNAADFFTGIIDEVRISNAALSPSDFLFATSPVGVSGDYNNDGVVNSADYVLWRQGGPLANEFDNPGTVDQGDYTYWRSRFGATSGLGAGQTVPEFSTGLLAVLAALSMLGCKRTRC